MIYHWLHSTLWIPSAQNRSHLTESMVAKSFCKAWQPPTVRKDQEGTMWCPPIMFIGLQPLSNSSKYPSLSTIPLSYWGLQTNLAILGAPHLSQTWGTRDYEISALKG